MKYLESLFLLILLTFCVGTLVSGCMDSENKTSSIHETLRSAKEKAENDKDAFINEMKVYKVKWNAQYEENKFRIAALKEDKENITKVTYNSKVEELDIANETIKKEIESAHIKGNLEWKNFKKTVTEEIDGVKSSINKFSE